MVSFIFTSDLGSFKVMTFAKLSWVVFLPMKRNRFLFVVNIDLNTYRGLY